MLLKFLEPYDHTFTPNHSTPLAALAHSSGPRFYQDTHGIGPNPRATHVHVVCPVALERHSMFGMNRFLGGGLWYGVFPKIVIPRNHSF